jgi:hypothetical protein
MTAARSCRILVAQVCSSGWSSFWRSWSPWPAPEPLHVSTCSGVHAHGHAIMNAWNRGPAATCSQSATRSAAGSAAGAPSPPASTRTTPAPAAAASRHPPAPALPLPQTCAPATPGHPHGTRNRCNETGIQCNRRSTDRQDQPLSGGYRPCEPGAHGTLGLATRPGIACFRVDAGRCGVGDCTRKRPRQSCRQRAVRRAWLGGKSRELYDTPVPANKCSI